MSKNYWLMKSEPDVWSIDQQQKAGIKGATWDGVRNYQAAKNLKKMRKGDLCFFYHSNVGKEIVGIMEIIKTAFLDKTDKEKARWLKELVEKNDLNAKNQELNKELVKVKERLEKFEKELVS